MEPNGSGTSPRNTSPARCRSSICFTPANTCGISPKTVPQPRSRAETLDEGKIEDLAAALRSIDSSSPELAEKIRIESGYFANNADRMRHPKFRGQHLFVGSGVIEAGCKTIIGSRCKQSGMFWTVRGANAILALRCCHFNDRFETYWEARRA